MKIDFGSLPEKYKWGLFLAYFATNFHKHTCTPRSRHNRFMSCPNSDVSSPSVELPLISKNFLASSSLDLSAKSMRNLLIAEIIAIRLWIVFEYTTGL